MIYTTILYEQLDCYISRNSAKTTQETVGKKEICLVAAVYDFKINGFLSFAAIFQWLEVNFNFVKGKNYFSDNIERFVAE